MYHNYNISGLPHDNKYALRFHALAIFLFLSSAPLRLSAVL